MSVSKKYVGDSHNVNRVLEIYCGPDRPTLIEVADQVGTTWHNVQYIVNTHLSPEKLKAEQALRYSRSKTGSKNPMTGKSGSRHHNYQGEVSAGHGYLQQKENGKYILVHRKVGARLLQMKELPDNLIVHHIDGDKTNNDLDNLAVMTAAAHSRLHAQLRGWRLRSKKLTLWEQQVSGT
jgi:hypothetical protein